MNTIKFLLKTLTVVSIYILAYSLIYSLVISKTGNNINIIVTLTISSIGMGIIGFCYANHFKKRGLIIGILIVLIHLIIIYLIKYFSTNTLDLNALKIGIQVLVGGIGGILGSNVKKVF